MHSHYAFCGSYPGMEPEIDAACFFPCRRPCPSPPQPRSLPLQTEPVPQPRPCPAPCASCPPPACEEDAMLQTLPAAEESLPLWQEDASLLVRPNCGEELPQLHVHVCHQREVCLLLTVADSCALRLDDVCFRITDVCWENAACTALCVHWQADLFYRDACGCRSHSCRQGMRVLSGFPCPAQVCCPDPCCRPQYTCARLPRVRILRCSSRPTGCGCLRLWVRLAVEC